MGGGKAGGAGTVAAAGIYTGGRIATNALTIAQAALASAAQLATTKWMIDRQQSMWDHVAAKQIACVEVALDEFAKSVENILPTFKDAYPDVPAAARFVPVDPRVEQYNQMVDNIINAPKTAEYMAAANHWHRINYLARAELLSPGFAALLDKFLRQVETLADGQLPVDGFIGVTTDAAENAAAVGKIGNTRMLTHTALGIKRLQMQQLARDEFSKRITWMQGISPVESEVTVDQLMIKPERRLLFALEQAQLLQNDLQNANNAAAQKAPHKMAELQTKLQKIIAFLQFNANKANMQNQFVPNFPALFAPAVNNLINSAVQTFGWEKGPASGQDLGGHLTPATPGTGTIS